MVRTGLRRVAAGLIWLGLAYPAAAADSVWDGADGLYPGEVPRPHTLFDDADPEDPVLASGVLTLATSENAERVWYGQFGSAIAFPDPWVIDFEMRVVSGSTGSPARGTATVFVTTAPQLGIAFQIGIDEIFLLNGNSSVGDSALLDTDDTFHTYRLEVFGDGSVDLYYDDALTLSGALYSSLAGNGDEVRVGWGNASNSSLGVSEWRRFEHDGAAEQCGDGALDPGEQCDDFNLDDGDGCDSLCVSEGACRFLGAGNLVSMDAEDATGVDNSGSWAWTLRNAGFANATGGAFYQALPNVNGGNGAAQVLDPPYLDYAFHLETAGDYQLFLRFDAPAAGAPPDDVPAQSDSLYASVLGQTDFYRFTKQLDPLDPPPNERAGSLDGDFATDPWQGEALLNSDAPFANPDSAVWTLPAGNHVVRITLREDGVALDKLVVQEMSLAAPTAAGPGPSELGCCGDATLDPGEECDDGNVAGGDGCSALCEDESVVAFVCAPAPVAGCLTASKASIVVSEKKTGAEKLKALLKAFDDPTNQADLGNPLTGTTRYDLCLYDAGDQLVAELSVDRAGQSCGPKQKPCAKDKGGKGWLYKDPSAEADGTKKIVLKSGPAGKGKTLWLAANKSKKGQNQLPTGTAAALAGAQSAHLQLVTSDQACFEAELTTVKKADGVLFKAKRP